MRFARNLLIVLAVLFLLFVAADRIAVHVAQNEAADKFQSSRNLAQKPSVQIEGFPFLTQLIGSKLDEVKVSATGMAVGQGVRLQSFHADLKGVKFSDDYAHAVADSATGTVVITYADLSAALPGGLDLSYAGDGKVKVSAKLLGQSVSGTVDPEVVDGSSIKLSQLSLLGQTFNVPGLTDALEPELSLAGLPSGLRLDAVVPGQDGITVTASGTGVQLDTDEN